MMPYVTTQLVELLFQLVVLGDVLVEKHEKGQISEVKSFELKVLWAYLVLFSFVLVASRLELLHLVLELLITVLQTQQLGLELTRIVRAELALFIL